VAQHEIREQSKEFLVENRFILYDALLILQEEKRVLAVFPDGE